MKKKNKNKKKSRFKDNFKNILEIICGILDHNDINNKKNYSSNGRRITLNRIRSKVVTIIYSFYKLIFFTKKGF